MRKYDNEFVDIKFKQLHREIEDLNDLKNEFDINTFFDTTNILFLIILYKFIIFNFIFKFLIRKKEVINSMFLTNSFGAFENHYMDSNTIGAGSEKIDFFTIIFHGPPGVGKTSLAISICKTMNLPYIKYLMQLLIKKMFLKK